MADELSAVEREALEALDLDGLVAFLRELIAIPSLDGDETPAQKRVAAWMADAGFETDVWPIDLDELAAHPDWCHEVDREEALGVVGWMGEPAAVEVPDRRAATCCSTATSTWSRQATRPAGRRRRGSPSSATAASTGAAPWI